MSILIFYHNKFTLINRHFSRELINYLLSVTIIVLVIFLGNQLIRYLNEAAAGNMALRVVGRLVLLEIPYLLGLLLPINFFISLLLIFGRWSADHELIVLKACGFSPWQRWQMIAKPCYGVLCLVSVLSLWVQPTLSSYRNQLLATTNAGASLDTLMPGKFQPGIKGNYIFYVEKNSVDHKNFYNIFVAEKRKTNDVITQWNLIKAKNADLVKDPKNEPQFIEINNGNRYVGDVGLAKFQIMKFNHYFLLTRNPENRGLRDETDAFTNQQLLSIIKLGRSSDAPRSLSRSATAELEWRIALPLSCLILGILACFFGEVPPRHGRYARLFPGVLFLIIYTNSLLVMRHWVLDAQLEAIPGVFWIDLICMIFILIYIIPWRRWWHRP